MSGCIDVGARRTWSARWKSCRRRPCSALYSLCSVYFIDCAGVGLQGACDTPAALILASARCRLRPPPSELFCSCLFIGRLRPETRRSENLAEISATWSIPRPAPPLDQPALTPSLRPTCHDHASSSTHSAWTACRVWRVTCCEVPAMLWTPEPQAEAALQPVFVREDTANSCLGSNTGPRGLQPGRRVPVRGVEAASRHQPLHRLHGPGPHQSRRTRSQPAVSDAPLSRPPGLFDHQHGGCTGATSAATGHGL